MRKAIIILFLALPMVGIGQTVTKTKTLKVTDLGNQRLEAFISRDTTYVLYVKTGQRVYPYVTCDLGRKERAIELLTFLYDLDVEKGDIIDLENDTHNLVTKNKLGGLRVYSEGKQFSGQLRKPNISGFIEAIREFAK